MDRRKFLVGSVGAAALGVLGKLAPAPISEIASEGLVLRTSLPAASWRTFNELSECRAFIKGMSQKIAHTIYYGTPEFDETQFTGLLPEYDNA